MKKKIIIGVVALVLILLAGYAYLNYRNRTASPSGKAELTVNGFTISISYSRPSVRGRLIFGTADEKALQPYGKYWRLGANESTEITVNKDMLFNEQPIKAGTYKMYAIPGPESFEIVLNSELGKWGYAEPNHELDILKINVPVVRNASPVEQFTISMMEVNGGINVIFEWADVKLIVPAKAQ